MRYLPAALLLSLSVASLTSALAQTRTDTFNASDVVVERTLLTPLPDGGCRAEWCGTVVSDTGERMPTACRAVELQGATNRNRCLTVIAGGVPLVAKELRVALDGGPAP